MAGAQTIPTRPPVADVLEAAWQGVRVNRMRLHLDTRSTTDIGGDVYADCLSVDLSLSADAATLIEHGLLTQADLDALPPCGVSCPSVAFKISAGKRRVRLECYWHDQNDDYEKPRHPSVQNFIDRVAAAVAPSGMVKRDSLSLVGVFSEIFTVGDAGNTGVAL